MSLTDRTQYSVDKNADLMVSIHNNATGDCAAYDNGCTVLAAKDGYKQELVDEEQKLACNILNELEALGIENQGILLRDSEANEKYENGELADYYAIIRGGVLKDIPTVLVEHAFVDDDSDFGNYLSSDAKLKVLAEADAKGIARYYQLTTEDGKKAESPLENYKEKMIKRAYMNLLETIGRLFGTSMHLQKTIEETEALINEDTVFAEELQHKRAELTALIGDLGIQQQAFVEKLAKAVDEKGQYKVAHSQNTADLSKKLCRQLNLNEKTTDLIYYAGLLQNIGKITLPESLFANKGKLSKEEWEKLQNHPNVGVNLLMNINFLSEVIPYIHYHKERWDGRGEPEGLKGNSIPFGSRIIAVADAYSAMTSDRPYRKAMESEKAIEIILSEAGIKWDKDVVSALSQIIR